MRANRWGGVGAMIIFVSAGCAEPAKPPAAPAERPARRPERAAPPADSAETSCGLELDGSTVSAHEVTPDPTEVSFRRVEQQLAATYDLPARHEYRTLGETFGKLARDPVTREPMRGPDGKLVYEVIGRYPTNAADADRWDRELDALVSASRSPEVTVAAMERQANLFDRLACGLASSRVSVLGPEESSIVSQLRESGRPDLVAKADALERSAAELWGRKKKQELDAAYEIAVRRYARAIALARSAGVDDARTARAARRLAHFTRMLGEDWMEAAVTATPDPSRKGSRLTYRRGQFLPGP